MFFITHHVQRKIPAMDSTRRTAIAGICLLAEVDIRVITIKLFVQAIKNRLLECFYN